MAKREQKDMSKARVDAFRDRVTEAGGRRLDVYLPVSAVAALERWKAHTGAQSDTEAVKLAILSAVIQTEA